MSRSCRRSIAWIALAAMLFGAVSPALAAALFPHRAVVLGRMLGIPTPAAAATHAGPGQIAAVEDDRCPHEDARPEPPSHTAHRGSASHDAHHGSTGHESQDDPEHAVHGTFCSFCLASSSVVTVLSAEPAALPSLPAATQVSGGPERRSPQVTLALHRARGPPALSV